MDYKSKRCILEAEGFSNDAIGWGALTSRRPSLCYGDPISGLDNELPDYNMNVLPGTIEAENFDYSPVNGNGRTYLDNESGNRGGAYRLDEDVDIEEIPDGGGYNLGFLETGEWYSYTVYVPETGTYDLSVTYSSNRNGGEISASFGGDDKTGFVNVPSTGGWRIWDDLVVGEGILLSQGVQI